MEEPKVIPLRVVKEQDAPVELVIEQLESLLTLAKEGELRGFVVVGSLANGQYIEGGVNIVDYPATLTALEILKMRLLGDLLEDE